MTALDRKQFLLGTGSLVWAGAQLSRLRVESPSALRRDLEAIVADEIARCGIPAVSLSIFGEGMSSIDIAVGRRCQGQSGEVTTNDAFQIGSTTKIFTALALARLHDRKRLDWNETLRSAFSDLPRLHPDYARLSLKHLLSHRSGMMRDFDPDFALPLPTGESRERRWSFAALALAAPPATAAGKYSYSSTGFICLGALMEKKLGIPWFELVRREVLDPLRIVGSVSGPPLDTGGKLIVAGHAKEAKGRLIPLLPPFRGRYASDLIDPAGGIWMPIREFGKLARAISANRDAMGTYLGAETYRDYLSFPFGGSYGLGLRREFRGFAGGNALGHYGTYMGFENHFFFSASKRRGMALNANVVGTIGNPILREIGERCAERLGWQPPRKRDTQVPLSAWVHDVFEGAEGTLTVLADGTARIATTKTGKNPWSSQAWVATCQLVDGQTYRVDFEARADSERPLFALSEWDAAPHTRVGLNEPEIPLNTTYRRHTRYFTPKMASGRSVKCPVFFVGDTVGTVEIRNLHVSRVNF